MKNAEPPKEEDLHAFVDGELAPARAEAIAAYLAGDKALAARVAAYRADKAALAAAFGDLDQKPLPQAWIDRIAQGTITQAAAKRRIRPGRWVWFSGAALALGIGIFATLDLGPQSVAGEQIIAEALAARSDQLIPASIIQAAAIEGADNRNQIVAAALGVPAKVPDLSRMDFRLETVKVYRDGRRGGAVELDYRDGQDRHFAIYLRRPDGGERFDQFQRAHLRICIWQDEMLGAVMSGPISGAEMQRLAALAYSGLIA